MKPFILFQISQEMYDEEYLWIQIAIYVEKINLKNGFRVLF